MVFFVYFSGTIILLHVTGNLENRLFYKMPVPYSGNAGGQNRNYHTRPENFIRWTSILRATRQSQFLLPLRPSARFCINGPSKTYWV